MDKRMFKKTGEELKNICALCVNTMWFLLKRAKALIKERLSIKKT